MRKDDSHREKMFYLELDELSNLSITTVLKNDPLMSNLRFTVWKSLKISHFRVCCTHFLENCLCQQRIYQTADFSQLKKNDTAESLNKSIIF